VHRRKFGLILVSVFIAVASIVPTLPDALRQHMMRAEYVLGGFFLVEYSG